MDRDRAGSGLPLPALPPLEEATRCPGTPEGLVLVDKPVGPSSHDIVLGLRRMLGGARAGHAGTLDPFASGLLVVAIGRATRLLRFAGAGLKTYEGIVRLGFATDTDDRTGRPLGEPCPVDPAEAEIDGAIARLSGQIAQVPPAYSARKHRGIRLYRFARRGREAPRQATSASIEWLGHERMATDRVRFTVRVSAGTYIRAIARDLGALLGCGGHLEELRRVASGCFSVEQALRHDADPGRVRSAILPLAEIPLGLPTLRLGSDACRRLRCGLPAAPPEEPAGAGGTLRPPDRNPGAEGTTPAGPCPSWVRLLDEAGGLVGIAELRGPSSEEPSMLHPRVIL